MTDLTTQRQRRRVPHAELIPHRGLAFATVLLGLGVAGNALLGPLVFEVIEYRYSKTLVNQAIGLDAVALFAVFPVALLASVLMWGARHGGLILAFVPATFAAYMLPQYVIGPEYLRRSGNNEQFFPFHLVLFVLAMGVFLFAWNAVEDERLRPHSRPSDRMRAMVLFALAVFILVGRWLPALIELVEGTPALGAFRENPTSFLLIGWLDLGIVVPAALAAAVGLLRGARWARKAAYAVIAWFALVPASIAAMAITMNVNGDPNADAGTMWVLTVAGALFTVGAAALFVPLFHRDH
ncbi:MAG: hypothetical protein OEO77_07185 [Acidimicrobiia bacterium]|nr:hypothetical protein [Acidimicrobiia bacterium]